MVVRKLIEKCTVRQLYFEKIYDMFKHMSLGIYTVYINPTGAEIEDAFKEYKGSETVRFIADSKTKKLYVWEAHFVIHFKVSKMLRLILSSTDVLPGYLLKGSSVKRDEMEFKKLLRSDKWSWLVRYNLSRYGLRFGTEA